MWKKARVFFGKQDGSATVETVLMFPLLMAIVALTVDLASVFNSRAEVLRVIQDANRNVSIGRIKDVASAEAYVEGFTSHLAPNAKAHADITAGVITTSVVFPASDVMMTGMFSSILSVDMTLSAQHLIEDWEA